MLYLLQQILLHRDSKSVFREQYTQEGFDHTFILYEIIKNGRPICRFGRDPSEIEMPNRRPTCFIGDPLETDMTNPRPIGDQNAWSETQRWPTCLWKPI